MRRRRRKNTSPMRTPGQRITSASAIAITESDGGTRRKYGYALPSLSSGLRELGEMMGTACSAATRAAVVELPEQPPPMTAAMS
eukprot:6635329-Prymnesium_polylepis.4